jgi:hypothetical protein
MTSIDENKIKLIDINQKRHNTRKRAQPPGLANYVWIFRMVAQSKGNALPFTELAREARRKSIHNNSIYPTLEKLSPKNDDIKGEILFRYDNLVKSDITNEQLEKLLIKLEESYNHLLQWDWKKVKPDTRWDRNGNRVITIQRDGNDKNNLIILKLVPKERTVRREDRAVLTIRKKFGQTEDIKENTQTDLLLRSYTFAGTNNKYLSFKIRKNYSVFKVPLFAEWKKGRLFFRSLSEQSYNSSMTSRRHIDIILTNQAKKIVGSYQKKIAHIRNSNNISNQQKIEKINRMQGKISSIYNKREYHTLCLNLKGLLLYAYYEMDSEEFNKSIENLAACDEYTDNTVKALYSYNELGQEEKTPRNLSAYRIKNSFPFLSHYNYLKDLLPKNFAFRQINQISKGLKPRLEAYDINRLKYFVTEQFFREIKLFLVARTGKPYTIGVDEYISEITAYLNHVTELSSILQKNIETTANVKHRYRLLINHITKILEENGDKNNVIPIHDIITEAKLSWQDISNALEYIEEKYGDKFTITFNCIISKQKTTELKSLLQDCPSYNDACESLVKNGIPSICINSTQDAKFGLFHKLGFTTRYEIEDDWDSNLIVIKKRNRSP